MEQKPLAGDWLICQISDSAFPAGGFAHSAGLEAAWQMGAVSAGASLEAYLRTQMVQTARAAIPYVAAAFREPGRVEEWDAACDAFLSNHVARRASAAQGQSFALAASRAFGGEGAAGLLRQIRSRAIVGHFAPVFGAISAGLELTEVQAVRLFAFLQLRGTVSAAVRLGIVGPLEGQQIQWRAAREAEPLLAHALNETPDSAVQTAPLLDLFQGAQDRLYSRLFQS